VLEDKSDLVAMMSTNRDGRYAGVLKTS